MSSIEHSENKIITCSESEVGPEMLQSGVQQTYNLQIIHRMKTEKTNYQLHIVYVFGILAALMFVERWTGALQVRSRFKTSQIVH